MRYRRGNVGDQDTRRLTRYTIITACDANVSVRFCKSLKNDIINIQLLIHKNKKYFIHKNKKPISLIDSVIRFRNKILRSCRIKWCVKKIFSSVFRVS